MSPSLLTASLRKVTLKNICSSKKKLLKSLISGATVCGQPGLNLPGRFSAGASSGSSHPGASASVINQYILQLQCVNCVEKRLFGDNI